MALSPQVLHSWNRTMLVRKLRQRLIFKPGSFYTFHTRAFQKKSTQITCSFNRTLSRYLITVLWSFFFFLTLPILFIKLFFYMILVIIDIKLIFPFRPGCDGFSFHNGVYFGDKVFWLKICNYTEDFFINITTPILSHCFNFQLEPRIFRHVKHYHVLKKTGKYSKSGKLV